MFIRKLAISNFAVRKSRAALTVAAVALSVSLVISVTSGYASLFEAAYDYFLQFMGSADARITSQNKTNVPWSIIVELRHDPDVAHVDPRLSAPNYIPDPTPDAPKDARKRVELIGIDRPGDHRVERMGIESGRWFDTSTGDVAVVDQGVAEMMKIKVGDTYTFPFVGKQLTLKIVGITHKPGVVTPFLRTVYVPLHTLQEFMNLEEKVSPPAFGLLLGAPAQLLNREGQVTSAMIDLKESANHDAFEQRWKARFQELHQPLNLGMTNQIRAKMEENLEAVKLVSYVAGAVSMLAAMFIIFSALSMGVSERQRSLAMLRAVGAFRGQIGALVVFEGILLAVSGILIGIPLGWMWIKILSLLFADIFSSGAVISWGGVLFASVGTLLTALAASLLPAWKATRVKPLEAMSPLSAAAGDGPPIGWSVIGAILLCVDPLLLIGPVEQVFTFFGASDPRQVTRLLQFYGHLAVGLPLLFVGMFLLAPMCVWIVERTAGPLVARLFGLRFALLRQQLSTGIWRAAGTCAALMVGLSVLIEMQVSGHTLLKGWTLPDKFPDVFIGCAGNLTPQQIDDLAHTEGIKQMMQINIASVSWGRKGGNPFFVGTALVTDGTMFIGVDPGKVFKMMELDFRLGNAADAEQKLKQGGWVVVTEEYHQLKHCNLGDEIVLGEHTFHIAGVIWSPGIEVMKGMYDMVDQFDQRTISSVFGSFDDNEKYFGAHPYAFACEIDPTVPREELIKRIKNSMHGMGLQVGDVREIKRKIQEGMLRVLHMLSVVAFAAMAVASLGVANTVMAGVRSRRWQFGILRSIGVTRGQLLRLVMAEALLLGLIGSVLGLAAGTELSADARAFILAILGYKPPLVIPWAFVAVGVGTVLFISLAASLWPAIDVARTEPLTLLQAGRSST